MPTQIQIENQKTNEAITFDNKTDANAYIKQHATDDFVATKTYQAKVFGVKRINYTIAFSQVAQDMRLAQEAKEEEMRLAQEKKKADMVAHQQLMMHLNNHEGDMKSVYQKPLNNFTKKELIEEYSHVEGISMSQKKHIIVGHIAESLFDTYFYACGDKVRDAEESLSIIDHITNSIKGEEE